MKKIKKFGILAIILCIIGYIYYYVTLPAINIHSAGFWFFLIGLFIIITLVTGFSSLTSLEETFNQKGKKMVHLKKPFKKNFVFKIFGSITLILIAFYGVGALLSSPIINAGKYQKLLNITEGDFADDIKEISYKDIPMLDKASASLLGSRKMGSMAELVSQFELADDYTQINYQETPVRVTPLKYGSLFKWFTNRSEGIPAYMRINMATQDVECVKLKEGMKYSEFEHFGRNIYRHLRFSYPTYIFDDLGFEIDDNGTPYYICPVKDFTIGLFGGQAVKNVVLVNAVTGEMTDYKVSDVPRWVDRVYQADLLISYYDYYGTLRHGYWNTLFSQKDCLRTTEGYNYIALDDDVWVYTGITSVGSDKSNVGFVIMNQRTAEAKFYPISGAEEFSAMDSAQGQVQNLGYVATFPLLLNIAGEPTYFMALKDNAGLVKKYAMVNIKKYQNVAIGDTVSDCEKTYIALMKTNGISVTNVDSLPSIQGKIQKIAEGVVDGNSHYYIMLDTSDAIYDVAVADFLSIIRYNIGDTVTLTYSEGSEVNTVLGIQ